MRIGNFPSIYGSIYVNDGSTSQTIGTGTTPVKLTGFTTNGLSKDVTNDVANNKITITQLGVYRVSYSCSFRSATAGSVWHLTPFLNGVAQAQAESHRKVSNANDVGNTGNSDFINVSLINANLCFE